MIKKLKGGNIINSKYSYIYLLFIIFIIYILLPTNNSTLDSYGYTSDIKYGQSLFLPHHLLYSYFLYNITNIVRSFYANVDVLVLVKIINSLFTVINLLILYKILKHLKIKEKEIFLYIIFAAFSYNTIRYGTEGEVYIIPITFSLLGSLLFIKYLNSKKTAFILLSGFFAATACLFHQIHFFWWLGLLIGFIIYEKKIKTAIFYIIPAFIVPMTYILVIALYFNNTINVENILHFVFHDYYSGSAHTDFPLLSFVLMGISLIRTFLQVHPNMLFILKNNFIYIIPLLFFIYMLYVFVRLLFSKKLVKKRETINKIFFKTHFVILLLHLLFALYSFGNVEFMVMMPLLLSVTLFYIYKFNKKILISLSLLLVVWNLFYGAFPNHYYNYRNDNALVEIIISHPNDVFFISDAKKVQNIYYYKTGIEDYENIKALKTKEQLDSAISVQNVYTDIINKPAIFNRAAVINLGKEKISFTEYNIEKTVQYNSLYGVNTVNKITFKNK